MTGGFELTGELSGISVMQVRVGRVRLHGETQ